MWYKLLYFFAICAYILGAFGGVGYALFNSAYLIAVSVLIIAVMAFPVLFGCIKKLME